MMNDDILIAQTDSIPPETLTRYVKLPGGEHALKIAAVLTSNGGLVEVTPDGELWTTVTERENDVWSVYQETFSATKYVVLVDLDGAEFPHRKQGQAPGRIDVTSIYYALDVATNSRGSLQYGVITRIDDTNADICYFAAIPFLAGATQQDRVVSLRGVPSQVKLDFAGGELQHGITNAREANVASVNTGTPLDSPAGVASVTPGVGDLVLKYVHDSGSVMFLTFIFYHTQE